MSTEAVADFIRDITIHFPTRFDTPEREREWLQSLMRALHTYDSDVLTEVARRIITTRTDRRFPLAAEIRKVCVQVVDDVNRGKLISDPAVAAALASENGMRWTGERLKLADDLCRTEMGRTAAHEGWILAMHDFIRNNGRMPNAAHGEIEGCRRIAAEFMQSYSTAMRGGFDGAKALVRLGDTMLKRQEELAAMALGSEFTGSANFSVAKT